MQLQLQKYQNLLMAEASVTSNHIGLAARNYSIYYAGDPELAEISVNLLQSLDCTTIIIAIPDHPLMEFLLQHQPEHINRLYPRDSESMASLHDIPIVYHHADKVQFMTAIESAMKERKGCFVEGLGIISQASLTIEQAYIAWSSILHALSIKYFNDVTLNGLCSNHEADLIKYYLSGLREIKISPEQEDMLYQLSKKGKITTEMACTGRLTVKLGLVDSFFGNISCLIDDRLFISQTAARLDELEDQIDCLQLNSKSTAAITASSELPAHHSVLSATGARVLLHGHPRFSIIMSFFTTKIDDNGFAWLENLLVVDGESGIGGLAESLTRGFTETGAKAIIVRGHGVFAISDTDCLSALKTLAETEQTCRKLFCNRLPVKK